MSFRTDLYKFDFQIYLFIALILFHSGSAAMSEPDEKTEGDYD